MSIPEDGQLEKARAVYREANRALKNSDDKEERLLLLESWQNLEEEVGNDESRKEVEKQMPQKVKKRRKIQTDDGMDAGWEEYFDYIFPDEEMAKPNLKLLALAKKWKENKEDDTENS